MTLPQEALQSGILNQASVDRAAQLFRTHGTLSLENAFPRELVAVVQQAFMDEYACRSLEDVKRSCLEVGSDRYMFSIDLKPPFTNPALYASPLILPIVRALLGNDCLIQSVGAVCAYPGSGMQHIHRDHPALFAEADGLSGIFPPYALTVVVPLVDLNEKTGTTALWEGSHRANPASDEKGSGTESALLENASLPWAKMGDCYFMDYRLLHGGTANNSDEPRPILYLVYSRPWFQDKKNFEKQAPLQIDQAVYDSIPEDLKPLFENARRGHRLLP